MNLSPSLRKIALTAHIVFSVGWFGSVLPYLALAIVGLTTLDAQMVRAAYLSMEVIGWYVIVPMSIAALVSGLLQSLGTQWGLFRHWWIVAKFALTAVATTVLLVHMQTVSRMARLIVQPTWPDEIFQPLRVQLLVHSVGGLFVILAAAVLSVFKPWGKTPYGRRQTSADPVAIAVRDFTESTTTSPFWARVVGYHVLGMVVVFLIVHIFTGGIGHHGH